MRVRNTKKHCPASGRRASLVVELLLLLPILMALLLGMVEFSMLIYANHQLSSASREGARAAAQGGDEEDVALAVRRHLGSGRLGDADIEVFAENPSTGMPAGPGEPVEVRVSVAADHVVPDLLRFIGYSIRDEVLVGRTVMRKE